MEQGESSVPAICPAPGNDVDYAAGAMSELCFVPRGQHLELEDRILIKRCGRSTINSVTVWHAINEKNGVSASLTKDGDSAVGSFVDSPVDRNTWNQLEQVEIVTPIDRHLLDLLRQDGGAGR